MRQVLWHNINREHKHFEIGNAILPRYFWELIESGVNSIHFQLEGLREKELPNGQGMVVECPRAGLIYTYKDAVVRENFIYQTRSVHKDLTIYSASIMAA